MRTEDLVEELIRNAPARAADAIRRLNKDEMLTSTETSPFLTEQSLNYISIVSQHDIPLGAAHLLNTLSCLEVLGCDYAFNQKNLDVVANTNYPEEFATILDIVFSLSPSKENVQKYLQCLMDLSLGTPEHVEKCLTIFTVRLVERKKSDWSLEAFEDELQLAVNSVDFSRDNLKSRAYDPESAIHPLTPDEDSFLSAASQYYASKIIERGGVNACYDALLRELRERYSTNPIYLEIEKKVEPTNQFKLFDRPSSCQPVQKKIALPLERDAFDELKLQLQLTPEDEQRALLLYYHHPLHTAYRFFSDIDSPGPWLADHKYWESFEEKKPLLAVLWLAVIDEEMAPTSDYTIEGRIEHFIISFAEFRRDKNNQGRRQCADGSGRYEYYDDGLGDKPGCGLGFRDRTFDAVQGHPLFGLSPQLIWWEVFSRVQSYFQEILKVENDDSLLELEEYWLKMIRAEISSEETEACCLIFSRLNVQQEQQDIWLQELKAKYQSLMKEKEPKLMNEYYSFFACTPIHQTHLHRFGGEFFTTMLIKEKHSEHRAHPISAKPSMMG